MQRRAAAIYGAVLLVVAAGAFAFVAIADEPEPALESFEHDLEEGDTFEVGDREYEVTGFGERRGEPTATFEWTDEDARAQEEWEHAEDPGGTTLFTEGTEYWVRIDQPDDDEDEDAEPESFTLLEVPGEDVDVFTDDDGQWFVQPDGENAVPLEEYEDLERVTYGVDDEFTVHDEDGEEERTVTVEGIDAEAVTVSWNEPQPEEDVLRQGEPGELNGVQHMAHFPDDERVQLTTDEEVMGDYDDQRTDRETFQQRIGGLHLTIVFSALTALLLVGLAFLPRKD